jgi:hypothetical protein
LTGLVVSDGPATWQWIVLIVTDASLLAGAILRARRKS